MTLNEYYDIILSKYISGSYKLRVSKKSKEIPVINDKEFSLYAINYMIFEYLKDNKDNRWKLFVSNTIEAISRNPNSDFFLSIS
jgi:hypothetical protein